MQIIVLGMHRSGTSMATRLVNMMGAHLGPDETIMRPKEDNPSGFWERDDVVAVNDRILNAGGGAWWDIVDYAQERIGRGERLELGDDIQRIVHSMDTYQPWVIKDPRLCVTLPLWWEFLDDPVCVHVYRDPLEIARSLAKRNAMPVGSALGLWECYTVKALEACRALPGFGLAFADLLADPVGASREVYDELSARGVGGLALPADAEIHAYVFPKALGQRDGANDAQQYLNESQRTLAECVKGRELPVAGYTPSAGGLEAQRVYVYMRKLEQGVQSQGLLSVDTSRKVRELRRRLGGLGCAGDAGIMAGGRPGQPALRDEFNEVKTRLEDQVRVLDNRLAAANARVETLNDWLVELDRLLSSIFCSWRWRVGHVVMSIVERLLLRGRVGLAKDHVVRIVHDFREFVARSSRHDLSELVADSTSGRRKLTRDQFVDLRREELREFLRSGASLSLKAPESPTVSVILVLYNRAELTLWSLRSLAGQDSVSCEVVIVDNHSTDETAALLDRVIGARVLRNDDNEGFVSACNQGAEVARGEYILLLNNDARLLPGALAAALDTMRTQPDAGAVGGKITALDGRAQEGGSIVWQDGSCLGYGRGESPRAPELMFRRDVDYCSGAFLLTPRTLFVDLGGFDECFAPAYYEDTDYCMRVQDKGLRVIYEPDACISHFEFASSSSPQAAIELQKRNRCIFRDRHAARLSGHYPASTKNIVAARSADTSGSSVLYVDDRVPHESLGSGFPRANRTVKTLVELGYRVTVYPLNFPYEDDWDTTYLDIPREVEIMLGYGRSRFRRFMKRRGNYYDAIVVSRPHNMAFFNQIAGGHAQRLFNGKLVYDAEALFSMRDLARSRISANPLSDAKLAAKVRREVGMAEAADAVFTVTENERKCFLEKIDGSRIHVLGHALQCQPGPAAYRERRDMLFVGNLDQDGAPNVDSLAWFVEEVLPIVNRDLDGIKLHVVGSCRSTKATRLRSEDVWLHGRVQALEHFYNDARIFVAPTRFAAGIPYKVHEAAARGVPVVATDLLVSQLEWADGEEILGAPLNDAEAFAAACVRLYTDSDIWTRIRNRALTRVETECSDEAYIETVNGVFESLLAKPRIS